MAEHQHSQASTNALKAESNDLEYTDQVETTDNGKGIPFASAAETTPIEAPPLLIGSSNIMAMPVASEERWDELEALRQQVQDIQERENEREQQAKEEQEREQQERQLKFKKNGLYLLAGLLLICAIAAAGVCGSGNCSPTSTQEVEATPLPPKSIHPPPTNPTDPSTAPSSRPSTAPSAVPSLGPTVVPTTLFKPFESTQKLYDAVDEYILADDAMGTAAANTYGHPIGTWDVSRITNFTRVFATARHEPGTLLFVAVRAFNEDLNGWDVGQATEMSRMFGLASSFDGDISNWNVERVTDMNQMFARADAFDGDISNWNVGRVTTMNNMFVRAGAFNGDISDWDVGQVTDTGSMFDSAGAFDQSLCAWRSRLPVDCNVQLMFSLAAGCPGDETPTLPDGDSMCQLCQE